MVTAIPIISVSIQQLKTEYDANQIAADNKYKGQILQVTGSRVDNISRGFGGKPYVSLGTGAPFEFWSATCHFRDEGQVLELQRGQIVTIMARNTGMSVGTVGFEDCELVK
ncbi:MAG: hypothetical protein FJ316_12750 [SAR202 cluster bacterium]|nr:hypothetical protein [SAR202 cluster bacterium]